jgi:hypothetical protein
MSTVLKPTILVAFLILSLTVSAQRSGRTGDPTLNKGEGLERTRNDLDKMRNQNQDKNARQLNLYMFGASFSLLDSVLYISEISEVDDVTVNNKWFIKDRSSFESQFTDRVKTDNDDSMLTSVYFSEKEKKVAKRRSRLVKRNAKKNKFLLIKVSDFTFSRPSENN